MENGIIHMHFGDYKDTFVTTLNHKPGPRPGFLVLDLKYGRYYNCARTVRVGKTGSTYFY